MPKSVPLRAIAVTMVLPSMPCAASAIALHAAITGFSTLSALSPRNLRMSLATCGVGRALCDERRERLEVEQRGGLVPVVAFVAHVQRLGQQRADVDPLVRRQRVCEDRRHHVVHPVELGDHVRRVRAHAQHLAVPLIQPGVAPVAVGLVLDDVDHHRRRDDAGHRPDGCVMVTRLEAHPPSGCKRSRLVSILGAALEDQRAHHGASLWPGHALPGHRWTCVHDQISLSCRV